MGENNGNQPEIKNKGMIGYKSVPANSKNFNTDLPMITCDQSMSEKSNISSAVLEADENIQKKTQLSNVTEYGSVPVLYPLLNTYDRSVGGMSCILATKRLPGSMAISVKKKNLNGKVKLYELSPTLYLEGGSILLSPPNTAPITTSTVGVSYKNETEPKKYFEIPMKSDDCKGDGDGLRKKLLKYPASSRSTFNTDCVDSVECTLHSTSILGLVKKYKGPSNFQCKSSKYEKSIHRTQNIKGVDKNKGSNDILLTSSNCEEPILSSQNSEAVVDKYKGSSNLQFTNSKCEEPFLSAQNSEEAMCIKEEILQGTHTYSNRAGLVFPVGRIHKKLEYLTRKRIKPSSAVYAAAVIQAVSSDLLQLAVEDVKASNKHTIQPCNLNKVSLQNKDIKVLLKEIVGHIRKRNIRDHKKMK